MEGCKVECFKKFRDEKQIFKSLGMKNELLLEFRDENDIFNSFFYFLFFIFNMT